jgi:hypothetical protein
MTFMGDAVPAAGAAHRVINFTAAQRRVCHCSRDHQKLLFDLQRSITQAEKTRQIRDQFAAVIVARRDVRVGY